MKVRKIYLSVLSLALLEIHVLMRLTCSSESIKNAASEASWGMMTYYHGNETGAIPGAFPEYWWEGSILFLALLNYWHYTKDDTYNDELSVGLQWQGGDNGDYLPGNYSQYLVSTNLNQVTIFRLTCRPREMTTKCSGELQQ